MYEIHRLGYQRRIVLWVDHGAVVIQVSGLAKGNIFKDPGVIHRHGVDVVKGDGLCRSKRVKSRAAIGGRSLEGDRLGFGAGFESKR